MLNKVQLIGRLGRDVELRQLQSGDSVANLSMATSEKWKKDGQTKEKTEWHRIVMFGKLAEIANQYLHKGSLVYIEGKLQTRKWTAQDGTDKYSTEVICSGYNGVMKMLDSKGSESLDSQRTTDDDPAPSDGGAGIDEDVPF